MPTPLMQVLSAVPAAPPAWTEVASAWAAIVGSLFALLTLVVAVAAVRYAKRQVDGAREQLGEARNLRREQAQPYVVIYAQPLHFSPHMVELVVENTGATAAREVSITSIPALDRTADLGQSEFVQLPEMMPVLVPHQQWRTFWDSSPARQSRQMTDRFEVTITYTDSIQQRHTEVYVLDWRLIYERSFITEKGVHHVATSLEDMTNTVKQALKIGRTFKVATYDGIARDERLSRERADREAVMDRYWRLNHPDTEADGPPLVGGAPFDPTSEGLP